MKYTWAIEDLYPLDELWQKEYDKVKEMLPKATEFQGRLGKSADLLVGFLQLTDEIGKLNAYMYMQTKNITRILRMQLIRICQIKQVLYRSR
jgi:oligoendopeptidase F